MVVSFPCSWFFTLYPASVVWIMHHLSTPCTRWITGALYPLRVKSVLGKAFCFAFRSLLSNALTLHSVPVATPVLPGTWASLARCSAHLPATGHFRQIFPPNNTVSEEGESMSLYHFVICCVSGRLHLTFQMSRFPAGAAQLCPPALISVCAAHKLTLVWDGWSHITLYMGWKCLCSSQHGEIPSWSSWAAPSAPPGSYSLSFAFPSVGPTHCRGSSASDTKPSDISQKWQWHVPPQPWSHGHFPAVLPNADPAWEWRVPSAAVIPHQQCQAPAPLCCTLSRCWKAQSRH